MNKKFFVTGEAKITSLLRDYIITKMKADFCCVDASPLTEEQQKYVKDADYIVLLHEVGRCTVEEAMQNMLLTKSVIECLPAFHSKAIIANFVPRKGGIGDDEARAIKLQSEKIVQDYSCASGSKIVLYRMPEVFGAEFDNEILDKLISDCKTEKPDASYEFIHIDDLFYELYRMANGAPAFMGRDSFAYPQGTFFSTESGLVKKFSDFGSLKPWEIPDFPSAFERYLYDYYLQKGKMASSCQLEGDVILSSCRFGAVSVKRLSSGEKYDIDLSGANGARLLLLCGCIKTEKGEVYCADSSIIRINLTENTMVENIGDGLAVIEIWSHTIS